jgi:hypothetical protein
MIRQNHPWQVATIFVERHFDRHTVRVAGDRTTVQRNRHVVDGVDRF